MMDGQAYYAKSWQFYQVQTCIQCSKQVQKLRSMIALYYNLNNQLYYNQRKQSYQKKKLVDLQDLLQVQQQIELEESL